MTHSQLLPVGAHFIPGKGVHFRVWAPTAQAVHVILENTSPETCFPLHPEGQGYHSALIAAAPGSLYRYRLDHRTDRFPDPASRFQPAGPHGPSEVIAPKAFPWTDDHWRGSRPDTHFIYELHTGTFTPEGTWLSAARHLPYLADLGVTLIELMPVADFPGSFGWGYDGVNLFAPTRLYGRPDDLRLFVDRAHALGIGIILDVVYNHLGPDGNYLAHFSPFYFNTRRKTDWGDSINFDGINSRHVRELFVANAVYWLREFHIDGLRFDATQQIYDSSKPHILAEIAAAVRHERPDHAVFLVAENEEHEPRLIRDPQNGFGLDAIWNEDFHRSAFVALTGQSPAYYSDYRGTPQEFLSLCKRQFLYQGQHSASKNRSRGAFAPDFLPGNAINFIQNHDQVSNSSSGHRLHQFASPAPLRAISSFLLLAPGHPMLFQGQEFAASAPFPFFADHHPQLAHAVAAGRRQYLSIFPGLDTPQGQQSIPDPHDPDTFRRCQLNFAEKDSHAEVLRLHRDLIHLRKSDPVLNATNQLHCDGAVLLRHALVLRFFDSQNRDRLLILNLHTDLTPRLFPEPLLAPPSRHAWHLLWTSTDPRYGDQPGLPRIEENEWHFPADSATLVAAAPVLTNGGD